MRKNIRQTQIEEQLTKHLTSILQNHQHLQTQGRPEELSQPIGAQRARCLSVTQKAAWGPGTAKGHGVKNKEI